MVKFKIHCGSKEIFNLTTLSLSDGSLKKERSTNVNETVICPFDGRPCEYDCPDRYVDVPEGGCVITTALSLGISVLAVFNENGG